MVMMDNVNSVFVQNDKYDNVISILLNVVPNNDDVRKIIIVEKCDYLIGWLISRSKI